MKIKLYPHYSHRVDPVMEKLVGVARRDGSLAVAAERAKISPGTLRNWDKKKTRRPQFATVCALARSMGDEGIQVVVSTIRRGK